jgi:uncharacterized membrane protein
VVGDYLDANGAGHGYLWEKGRFTSIDVRDAAATTITALNEPGETVGLYFDAAGTSHRFFRTARGRISTVDAAGVLITLPFDVNNRGQIVGITTTAPSLGPEDNEVHRFVLRDGAGGPFTRIDAPGATDTGASGIDNRGRVVGLYQKPSATPSALRARPRTPAAVPALRIRLAQRSQARRPRARIVSRARPGLPAGSRHRRRSLLPPVS